MAVSAFKGSFAKSTSGAPVDQAVTSVGFQPEVLIFWGTTQTAEGYAAHAQRTLGFASAAGVETVGSFGIEDGVNPSNSVRSHNDAKCISWYGTGLSILAEADLKSFDADGFTVTWTTNNANAYIIHFLALAGDITNAFTAAFIMNNSLGNQSITAPGFQPDIVLFAAPVGGGGAYAASAATNSGLGGFGAATSATARWSIGGGDDDALSPTDTNSKISLTTVVEIFNTCGDHVGHADFVSMDVNGFTINVTDAAGFTPFIHYLCLKGGSYFVGNDTQKTSTGTKATTGVGFKPSAVLFGSNDSATTGSSVAGWTEVIGAGDGTNEGAIWTENQDAVATSEVNQRTVTTKVLSMSTGVATTDAEADLTSLDSDGFTLDWTTADATARAFGFIAFGPAAAGGATIRRYS